MRESLRDSFENCRYRVQIGRSCCDLRIGEPAHALERQTPRCCSYSLITAWNPQALQMPRRGNLASDRRLVAWLEAHRLQHWPALNGEGPWREDAWLVGNPPLHQLDRLAEHFGQLATLHWRRGQPVALRWHLDQAPVVDAGRAAP